jgi:hypothetical protein
MYFALFNLALVLVTFSSLSHSLNFYQNYDPVDLASKKNVDAACIAALYVPITKYRLIANF